MSKPVKNLTIETSPSLEESKESMLYRPQLLKYKYKTCIEKPVLTDTYDPDTMNSLKSLMKTTSLNMNLSRQKNPSYTRYQEHFETSNNIKSQIPSDNKNLLPQWIKYDKNVLRFEGYFDEHVTESAYENWRIRPCTILYYLEDDTVHVIENKYENSGIPQGDFIKRRRTKLFEKDPELKRELYWKDLNLGKNITIFDKSFRLCKCDKFTKDFYDKNGIVLNPEEEIPQIDFSSKYSMIDFGKIKKNIAEMKEYTEVGLGGGHPNGGLEQFLENDRKVLRFDISWYDPYDKEEKYYKLHFYLSDNQIEICEIKVNNSGKDNFPKLLRKSMLPKIPRMTYCPGIEHPEEEYYMPKDLLIGNYIYVYNRKCKIFGCDEFTKNWYKENLGINMESIKLKTNPKQNIIHPIPPYNGYGTEEDSLLNVKYLNFQYKTREHYVNKFKRDKHILRFLSKLISPIPSDEERKFLLSFYCRDEAIQVYEIADRNSGRKSGKFYEKQRVKNPYTKEYYTEKDFVLGNLIYVNKYTFKLIEMDEYTKKYMISNKEIFRDADIKNVVDRIKLVSNDFTDFDEFLVHLLFVIDPKGTNFVSKDDIINGLKTFGVYLSEQEISTLISRLNRSGNLYSMEDLYNYLAAN